MERIAVFNSATGRLIGNMDATPVESNFLRSQGWFKRPIVSLVLDASETTFDEIVFIAIQVQGMMGSTDHVITDQDKYSSYVTSQKKEPVR